MNWALQKHRGSRGCDNWQADTEMQVKAFVLVAFLFFSFEAGAQKQLVILKKGRVQARFIEGDYLEFYLKGSSLLLNGFIVELNEFSMITSQDTVPFRQIRKINIRNHRERSRPLKKIGGILLLAGASYIIIDQLNAAFGYNPSGFDESNKRMLVVAATGAALIFIEPTFLSIRPGLIFRTVDYKSRYYKLP